MERSDGNDDELYPPAPIPAHEREWRHPSEIGARAWAAAEPPVAIGRGLTFSAGAIGSLLVVGVLFTMLPTHPGRSAVMSVRSTISTGSAQPPAAAFGPVPSTPPSTVAPSTEPPTTLAVHRGPVPTYAVPAPDAPEPGEEAPPTAVAVAVGIGGLVVTIAPTTEGHLVKLESPDGGVETAEVLAVDESTGLAVLSHSLPADDTFEVAPPVEAGDVLSFYGTPTVTALVEDDGSVSLVADGTAAPEVREGTPVVNDQGQLVALCAHHDDVMVLVPLDELEALRAAAAAKAAERVWLGIMLPSEQGDVPVIAALEPDGPASVAGLLPGDELVSIDGNEVPDHLALGIVLAGHQPGDTIRVVVRREGVLTQFQVELGEPRPRL